MITKSRRAYVKRFRAVSDGSADYDVDTDPVKPGRKIVITHWSIKDETNAFTDLLLGRYHHGYFHVLEEQPGPQKNQWYWSDREFHFTEGDVIRTRFTGTTSGDILYVHLDGYMEEES